MSFQYSFTYFFFHLSLFLTNSHFLYLYSLIPALSFMPFLIRSFPIHWLIHPSFFHSSLHLHSLIPHSFTHSCIFIHSLPHSLTPLQFINSSTPHSFTHSCTFNHSSLSLPHSSLSLATLQLSGTIIYPQMLHTFYIHSTFIHSEQLHSYTRADMGRESYILGYS